MDGDETMKWVKADDVFATTSPERVADVRLWLMASARDATVARSSGKNRTTMTTGTVFERRRGFQMS